MTRKYYFIFILLFIKANSIAQLVDTSLIFYNHYKNHTVDEIIRRYLIGTSGGTSMLIIDSLNGNMVNSSTYPSFFTKSISSFDSINSIKINTDIKKNKGLWNNIRRNLVNYDNLGRVTDSLCQVWNNNSWLDSAKFSYDYNLFDSLNYFENLTWNGSQFENKSRTEYYYSATHKDSIILTFQGNLQNWIPAKRINFSYDNSDSLTLILTQFWNGSIWIDSIQETFTYNFLPDSSECIKQDWVNPNWENITKTVYYYSSGPADSAHVYYADTNGNFNSFWTFVYKFYTGKSFSKANRAAGTHYYVYDSTDIYGHFVNRIIPYNNGGYTGLTLIVNLYDNNGKLFYYYIHSGGFPLGHDLYITQYNYDPLVNYFPLQTIANCQLDTLLISSDVSGTNPPYSYNWSSTAYIDSPSAASIHADTISKYYLTVRDTLGNVFHDSIYVANNYQSFLGDDINTTVGSSVTLDAGVGYTSYLWQDSSTNRFLTITSLDTTIITAIVFVTDSNGCTGIDTINITFYVNGIDDLKKDMIVVSPNPATDYLKINNIASGEIKMYDSIGRIYLSMKADPGTQIISLKTIPRGIYLLEISSEKGHQIKKVILQ